MKYLDAPEGAADEEVFSMNLFTHEVMQYGTWPALDVRDAGFWDESKVIWSN